MVVDAGKAFVKAYYQLEGDGPLAPICYEVLSSVRASVQVKHWLNSQGVASLALEAQNPAMEQLLLTHVYNLLSPTLRGSFGMNFYL